MSRIQVLLVVVVILLLFIGSVFISYDLKYTADTSTDLKYDFNSDDLGAFSGFKKSLETFGPVKEIDNPSDVIQSDLSNQLLIVVTPRINVDVEEISSYLANNNKLLVITDKVLSNFEHDDDEYDYVRIETVDRVATSICLDSSYTSDTCTVDSRLIANDVLGRPISSGVRSNHFDFGAESYAILYDRRVPFYIKSEFDGGVIAVHSVPWMFNNMAFQQDSYMKHFNRVFAGLEADSIYITHVNNLGGQAHQEGNILEYVLDNKSLKYSYYSLLVLGLIFIGSEGRRVIQAVKVISPVKNTSVEFSKTLSAVYYHSSDNHSIVKRMIHHYFHFIEQKYYVKKSDEKFIAALFQKSGVALPHLEKIDLLAQSLVNKSTVEDNELVAMNALLNYFYKNAE